MAKDRCHILVVDDHEDTARATARLLEFAGYEVRTASTLADARERCEHEDFDLLICDIGLPDGSGIELLRDIRTRSNVRAIAYSGYGTNQDIEAALTAGFSAYLIKPVSFADVLEAIHGLISQERCFVHSQARSSSGVNSN